MNELRWGVLSTAEHRRREGHPGHAQVGPRSGRGHRLARRARERGPSPSGTASSGSTDRTRRCWPTPEVDAVYIPLPNHLHAEWTKAAARAGKHVLCEKPLAMTAADAESMIAVCEAEGVRLMEAFMYRLHPSWVAVRELVAAGRIGRLTAVHSWFSLLQRRPGQHPQHPGRRWRRALRHRLLQRQPVAHAVRRRAGPRRGGDHPRRRRAGWTS